MGGPLIKYYPLYGSIVSGTITEQEIDFEYFEELSFTTWDIFPELERNLHLMPAGGAHIATYIDRRAGKAGLEFFVSADLYAALQTFAALARAGGQFAITDDKDKQGFLRVKDRAYAGDVLILCDDSGGYERFNADFAVGDRVAIVNPAAQRWTIARIESFVHNAFGYAMTVSPRLPFDFSESEYCYVTHANYVPFAVARKVEIKTNHYITYTFYLEFVEVAPPFVADDSGGISQGVDHYVFAQDIWGGSFS